MNKKNHFKEEKKRHGAISLQVGSLVIAHAAGCERTTVCPIVAERAHRSPELHPRFRTCAPGKERKKVRVRDETEKKRHFEWHS